MSEGIGDRIKKARVSAGFPVGAHFAERVGLRPEQLSRYEHGHIEPGTSALVRIASECGVFVEWLITGRGPVAHPEAPEPATGTEG